MLALEDNLVKTIGLPLACFIWEQDKRLSKDACLEKVTRICENSHAKNKEIYLLMPPICRKKETDLLRAWDFLFADSYFDGMIVASYDGLGFLESIAYPRDRVILDHRLYTFSDRSQQAFAQMGYPCNTAPLELNAKELRHQTVRTQMQEAAIIGRGHIICKTATKRDFQLKTAVLFVIMRYTTARSIRSFLKTRP